MMIPWTGIAFAVIATVSFGSGALVTHWKHGSDELHDEQARQRSEDFARELVSEIAGITAEAIGGIRVENRTIYQATRTEILREPVYSECLVPVAGGVYANEARGYAVDRSGADATVPENPADTDKARRSD